MKIILFIFSFLFSYCLSQIPIIIDTDIGSAMDDTWAIGYLLTCPEIDIKLIVTATQNTTQRAQVIAKFLQSVGRFDIPIGIGISSNEYIGPQYNYAKDYSLELYPGIIYEDGIQAMVDTIEQYPSIIILELAPATNFAQVIIEYPQIISNQVRVITMGGSIYKGYNNSDTPVPEYNIAFNISAAQIMYSMKYTLMDIIAAPLDTSGNIFIWGDNYQKLEQSRQTNELVNNILINYEYSSDSLYHTYSTLLCDVEASSFLVNQTYVTFNNLNIQVNNTGFTIINNEQGQQVREALYWKDRVSFQDYITNKLLSWNNI